MAYLIRLKNVAELSEQDEDALINAADRMFDVKRGKALRQGGSWFFIADGWAGLLRSTADGQQMILQVAIPGDLLAPVNRTDTQWVALTDLAAFPAPAPGSGVSLAAAYEKSRKIDCLNYESHIARCGFMSAVDRMIDFFVELDARSSLIEHTIGGVLAVPLIQVAVGEILGLTMIHVNRTRRAIMESGRATLRLRSVQLGPELQERSRDRRQAYISA